MSMGGEEQWPCVCSMLAARPEKVLARLQYKTKGPSMRAVSL